MAHAFRVLDDGTRSVGVGHEPRASWASHPDQSRGRRIAEPASPTRTDFQRDRDRVIHSTAFRRLKHKTQVFVSNEGDHYRTRLTHSIEVGQIARGIARALRLDEDLTEAIALAHDFGHTPFGHAGERMLDAKLKAHGHQGFDHNAQSLRILTQLEHCYATFDGLNMTWETVEGLVKHNGPISSEDVHPHVAEVDREWSLDLSHHASLEAQCAAIADDIAYNAHDIDDGLRSGLISVDQIRNAPLAGAILARVEERHGRLPDGRLSYEIVRGQITQMVEDVIGEALANLEGKRIKTPSDVRQARETIVRFSDKLAVDASALKAFLFGTLYRNPEVMAKMAEAQTIIGDLFDCYVSDHDAMSPEWSARAARADDPLTVIADYIAGMTDSYAIKAHRALFDQTPELF